MYNFILFFSGFSFDILVRNFRRKNKNSPIYNYIYIDKDFYINN